MSFSSLGLRLVPWTRCSCRGFHRNPHFIWADAVVDHNPYTRIAGRVIGKSQVDLIQPAVSRRGAGVQNIRGTDLGAFDLYTERLQFGKPCNSGWDLPVTNRGRSRAQSSRIKDNYFPWTRGRFGRRHRTVGSVRRWRRLPVSETVPEPPAQWLAGWRVPKLNRAEAGSRWGRARGLAVPGRSPAPARRNKGMQPVRRSILGRLRPVVRSGVFR